MTLVGVSAAEKVLTERRLPDDAPYERFQWLQPKSAASVLYYLRLPPGVRFDIDLNEVRPLGGKLRSSRDLPADFVKKLEEAARQAGGSRFVIPPSGRG